MKLLNIDTSNQPLSVSITDGIEVLVEYNSGLRVNHSITLMKKIELMLADCNMTMKDIEGICVAKGPGSYTGLRIGVTAAKTLAYTLNIPLFSVSSLQMIAATARMHEFLMVPVIDARRDYVFSGTYQFKGITLNTITEDRYISIEDLNKELMAQHLPYLFVGVDTEKLKDKLKGPTLYMLPKSSEMRRIYDKSNPENVFSFEPAYLRISEAERNWIETQG